jgi:prolyl-tRNA editing enzyme YbaK/EbsC (Cys-tRNA(Pro) deacylase)
LAAVLAAVMVGVICQRNNSMESILSNSAKRVQDYLSAMGFLFDVKELPGSTRTAQEAADSIGCRVAQIAKSLVFKEKKTARPVLVVASGANRVDVNKIQQTLGLKLGKADAAFVRERVGYAIGGIPPAAHNEPLETLLDADLQKHETIWAAAGTPFAVFRLKPADLEAPTQGTWIDLSEEN